MYTAFQNGLVILKGINEETTMRLVTAAVHYDTGSYIFGDSYGSNYVAENDIDYPISQSAL